ncbi:sulfite exporter TauE/SafE family protein [Arthrobacter koreensis]|uniref:Probable membrane transporter protein n=1 Tax=Arthrobacter koreensis TaxID=199136 RepID=A0ABY6FN60_9MICC|nr:sulfite exporter TauE/SafE family protein [Arthrobacter koreensis]MEB7448101.1 sulfite exporter TauE/SafE family protein [Arthrobacter koreensis]UYB34643.1 sulfite exporter TauE/SafE family protein [Arthrobacter koreensis]
MFLSSAGWLHDALILFAGLWAGTINAVVGSGTLVTFPVLVALGYAPVAATISNAMGLIAGNVAGSWGYRRELAGLGGTLLRLLPASILGGITGAWLLLHLPEEVFGTIAPFLIVVALLFVIFQPRLQSWARERAARRVQPGDVAEGPGRPSWQLTVLVFLAGIYGGYFVAAQGILLVGILGIFLHGTLQNANAVKNVLVLGVNVVAASSYLLFAFDRIIWPVVALIAVGSLIGGFVGAAVGRRLPPVALRAVIVLLGLTALWFMVF